MIINPVLEKMCKKVTLGSSKECYDVMYFVTRLLRCKTILEIGTHRGGSAIAFAQAVLDNGLTPRIYTVDNWSGEETRREAEKNMKAAGIRNYVKMWTGNSRSVVPVIMLTRPLWDLVFIDGDHSPKAILKDFDSVRNHTTAVLFHDTGDGDVKYLKTVKNRGWGLMQFNTVYAEGNGHLVGITLARLGMRF